MMRFKIINEAFLDADETIIDYGTKPVVDDKIFDSKTHTSFYDTFLTDPSYMEDKYNLKGEIKMMSPNEYYAECAEKIFNTNVEHLKAGRSRQKDSLQEIKDVIVKYKRTVFLPYINYAEKQQEGLHRMMVAGDLFGWDHKFPVLVVTYADEERQQREDEYKRQDELRRYIKECVKEAFQYRFSSLDEFEEEVRYQVENKFDFLDIPITSISFNYTDDEVIVTVNGIDYQDEKDLIQIEDRKPDDIENIDDDILLDDDFLKKFELQ